MFVVLGVLILNTGTPDAPTPEAIRPYLKQFLSDRNLINVPRIIWKPVLNFCILPNRPKKTAAHYQQFWTEEGSPFLAHVACAARQASRSPDGAHGRTRRG